MSKSKEFLGELDIQIGKRIEKLTKGKDLSKEELQVLFNNTHEYMDKILNHEDNKEATKEIITKAIFDNFDARINGATEQLLFNKKVEQAIPNALKIRTYEVICETPLKTIFGNKETGSVVIYDNIDTTTKIGYSPLLAKFISNFSNGLPINDGISHYKDAMKPKISAMFKTLGFKPMGSTTNQMVEDVFSKNALGYLINKGLDHKGFETSNLNLLEFAEIENKNKVKLAATQVSRHTFTFDESVALRIFYNEAMAIAKQKETMQNALTENTKEEIKQKGGQHGTN